MMLIMIRNIDNNNNDNNDNNDNNNMIIDKVGHDMTIRKAELRTRQVKSE